MPAIFPILAIFAVFVFISAHATSQPKPKKKKSPSEDLAKALEKVIKASGSKEE